MDPDRPVDAMPRPRSHPRALPHRCQVDERPIINDTYIADEHRCVVEFEVEHPEHGIVPIVDVFTIDKAGQITRLAVYRR